MFASAVGLGFEARCSLKNRLVTWHSLELYVYLDFDELNKLSTLLKQETSSSKNLSFVSSSLIKQIAKNVYHGLKPISFHGKIKDKP